MFKGGRWSFSLHSTKINYIDRRLSNIKENNATFINYDLHFYSFSHPSICLLNILAGLPHIVDEVDKITKNNFYHLRLRIFVVFLFCDPKWGCIKFMPEIKKENSLEASQLRRNLFAEILGFFTYLWITAAIKYRQTLRGDFPVRKRRSRISGPMQKDKLFVYCSKKYANLL